MEPHGHSERQAKAEGGIGILVANETGRKRSFSKSDQKYSFVQAITALAQERLSCQRLNRNSPWLRRPNYHAGQPG
jgi:hypothetical protein